MPVRRYSDACNSDENDILLTTFNRWNNKTVMTTIGENVAIRFGKTISLGISLGTSPPKMFGMTFEIFVNYINQLHISTHALLFKTFEQTMTLKYLSDTFIHWNDVKDDILWKLYVEQYLNQLIYKILHAYHIGTLKQPPPFMKFEQWKKLIIEKKQKHLQIMELFEKRKIKIMELFEFKKLKLNKMYEPPLKRRKLSNSVCISQNLDMLPIEKLNQLQTSLPFQPIFLPNVSDLHPSTIAYLIRLLLYRQ
eukprot:536031_1